MSISLSPDPPKTCRVCGAAPIASDAVVCSMECWRVARHCCQHCGAFTLDPEAHHETHHAEATLSTGLLQSSADATLPEATTDDPDASVTEGRPAAFDEIEESPGERVRTRRIWECDDCGQQMSKPYARTFAQEDGTLYCPECRSRTERYSNDRP